MLEYVERLSMRLSRERPTVLHLAVNHRDSWVIATGEITHIHQQALNLPSRPRPGGCSALDASMAQSTTEERVLMAKSGRAAWRADETSSNCAEMEDHDAAARIHAASSLVPPSEGRRSSRRPSEEGGPPKFKRAGWAALDEPAPKEPDEAEKK